jgi:tetratricopeptide (TPR) repeat protein
MSVVNHRRALLALVLGLVTLGGGCAAIAASTSFDAASAAFDRGDYAAAAARIEETLRQGTDSARLRILLGWSYLKLGELKRATTELERSLALDPRDPSAYYAHEGLGWVAYRTGDHDRALAAFGEALRLAPGYHHAHTGLGWAYLAKRDLERAEANFEAALGRVPGDSDARRGLGFVAYHRGDWAKAIARFEDVLRGNEGDSLSRSALGWAHYYKGDHAIARSVFQQVARREPTWADPLLGLAWIAERQGRRDDAKAGFRAALARSASYVATADPAASLRTLLAGRPDWLDVWRDLGWALYHQRAFALAEVEFRALLDKHPGDADGHRGVGYALFALKRYRDAVAPLERARGTALPPVRERVEVPGAGGLHPITSDAASTLAWTHYHSGELRQALALFRDVTVRHPDWADAWSGLGWTLSKNGDRGEAERAFRRALVAQPGHPDALAGLRALGRRP